LTFYNIRLDTPQFKLGACVILKGKSDLVFKRDKVFINNQIGIITGYNDDYSLWEVAPIYDTKPQSSMLIPPHMIKLELSNIQIGSCVTYKIEKFKIGEKVIISDLISKPELNEKEATVIGVYNEENGRIAIKIPNENPSENPIDMLVKPTNLRSKNILKKKEFIEELSEVVGFDQNIKKWKIKNRSGRFSYAIYQELTASEILFGSSCRNTGSGEEGIVDKYDVETNRYSVRFSGHNLQLSRENIEILDKPINVDYHYTKVQSLLP
jgi:hypothetical protein